MASNIVDTHLNVTVINEKLNSLGLSSHMLSKIMGHSGSFVRDVLDRGTCKQEDAKRMAMILGIPYSEMTRKVQIVDNVPSPQVGAVQMKAPDVKVDINLSEVIDIIGKIYGVNAAMRNQIQLCKEKLFEIENELKFINKALGEKR